MSAPAENTQTNEIQTSKPSEVMVVDHWLIFDCPHCQQTIKLDRKDSVHDIECPSCHSGFEPLLDRDVVLPPSRKAPSARKRARRRGPRQAGDDDDGAKPSAKPKKRSRPTASSLPSEGMVKLSLTPNNSLKDNSDSQNSVLPVRSALELERRRVESLDTESLQPDESELDAVIEEQSGGNYKRIRVRTRKKRLTEKQRAFNLFALGGLASVAIIGLSLWGASKMFHEGENDQADSNTKADDAYADSDPIGNKIGNRNALITEFISATTVDQLLKLVRYPKRLEPTIRAFYGGNDLPKLSVKSVNPVTGIQGTLPKNFSRYQMLTGSDSVALYIEKTDTHGYRADWESFVGLSSMPWEDFIASKATRTARMRVYLTDPKNSYYEAPFDKDRYRSLRIEDPSRKHTLYGYFEKNNTDLRRLTEKFYAMEKKNHMQTAGREFELSVILDIRYPAGASNPAQVEILKYVTDSWLRP